MRHQREKVERKAYYNFRLIGLLYGWIALLDDHDDWPMVFVIYVLQSWTVKLVDCWEVGLWIVEPGLLEYCSVVLLNCCTV